MSDFESRTSMRDAIFNYDFANLSIKLAWFEFIVVALIIGGSTESYGWGVGIFLLLILLQGIPLISGVFTLAFSLIESICLGGILSREPLIN